MTTREVRDMLNKVSELNLDVDCLFSVGECAGVISDVQGIDDNNGCVVLVGEEL